MLLPPNPPPPEAACATGPWRRPWRRPCGQRILSGEAAPAPSCARTPWRRSSASAGSRCGRRCCNSTPPAWCGSSPTRRGGRRPLGRGDRGRLPAPGRPGAATLLAASAQHFTPADYRDLRGIRDAYSAALAAGQVDQWGELNRRFPSRPAAPCRPASFTVDRLALLQDCDRPTRLQLSVSGDVARPTGSNHHDPRPVRAGDIPAAAALLRGHVEHAGRSLIAIYPSRAAATA